MEQRYVELQDVIDDPSLFGLAETQMTKRVECTGYPDCCDKTHCEPCKQAERLYHAEFSVTYSQSKRIEGGKNILVGGGGRDVSIESTAICRWCASTPVVLKAMYKPEWEWNILERYSGDSR